MLAKYTTSNTSRLTLHVRWQQPWGSATAFASGEDLSLEAESVATTVTVDLDTVEFVEFSPWRAVPLADMARRMRLG